jgi:signal transduction histidine kinase
MPDREEVESTERVRVRLRMAAALALAAGVLFLLIDTHLKTFAARHQIATSLDVDGLPDRLPPEFETAIYRIAQEALTNIARHASAQRVRVALVAEDGELRLGVEDDGVGVRPNRDAQARVGIGLIGIRERARALGGTVRLESSTKGVRLHVAMPLPGMVAP